MPEGDDVRLAGLDYRVTWPGRSTPVTLPEGPWAAPSGPPGRYADVLGLLVLSGLTSRTVVRGSPRSAELLGSADLIRSWAHDRRLLSVPTSTARTVLEPAIVAVLDGRAPHLPAGGRGSWPTSPSAQRSRWLALQLAIAHHKRVDTRLLLRFWHLADRWGQVRPEGVVLPLRTTHALVASLLGAQRPSVTSGLGALAAQGILVRRPDGFWLRRGSPSTPWGEPRTVPAED